jgi:hypothetical protein
VIVHLGDFSDVSSINPHGKRLELEGQRYRADVDANHSALEALTGSYRKLKNYHPRQVLTLGNHEDRIDRLVKDEPWLRGTIAIKDLGYERFGWDVRPFLEPIVIDGFHYAHYFISGPMGKPVSSAKALLTRVRGSAVMGHVQGFDMAVHQYTGHIGMFAGVCNTHKEAYLTPQGNNYRRHIVFLHEVANGIADPMLVSLKFLEAHYS